MKEVLNSDKYINHVSGLPIRVPPYLREELRRGEPLALVQERMMRHDPLLGQRGEMDRLPENMAENIRLRRAAHIASAHLVEQAKVLGSERYTTVVHGSLSKGVVRQPDSGDPSDIDIALVVDQLPLDKDQKRDIYKPISRDSVSLYGVKTDVHIWTIDEMLHNQADLVRVFLRSGGYSIANEGQVWEQLRWIGLQCQMLLQQGHKIQTIARGLIPRIAQGEKEAVLQHLLMRRNGGYRMTYQYLTSAGLLDAQYAQSRASVLLPVLSPTQKICTFGINRKLIQKKS